ncbi:NlpC/P60 family protein [Salegentibacter sp. F188]|uniref:NlpC/P60 family protein n=1 Tax=Autumnicola patrickiae TaxID=3075591 RepID=A0ABU3E244_9FLAO|nr:NlpC/P60 family protein [Salegentibacter sp. F188]MDT0690069.1 NlpC/P60 family protein [Salegentibacter sp. F188]
MQYGICHLSIAPVRFAASHQSEMVSQILYGEHFKVLEERGKWSRIRLAFDGYEAWISNNQYLKIREEDYNYLLNDNLKLSADLFNYVVNEQGHLMSVPLGSSLNFIQKFNHSFEGEISTGTNNKENLIHSALLYLNSPYCWGGKSPLGIDASGLSQMVYRLNGHRIKRTSAEQATQGIALSFIEESEPGDLAFFDNNEGIIDHVGIMMQDNYIIHVDGMVRIDRIDHSGIFNVDLKRHTHQLRVIKKII